MTDRVWTNASGTLHGSAQDLEPGAAVRLRASHCDACDRWEFPVRWYCPTCSRTPMVKPLSGEAEVMGFSAVLHQPPGALVQVPYAVALARFPEGVAVLGAVEDIDYQELELGDRVATVARQIGDSVEYAFRLDRSQTESRDPQSEDES